LADSAERADEIDEAQAEAALRRAEETMAQTRREDVELARAEAALRRSMTRLKVAKHRGQRSGRTPGSGGSPGQG
jgi:F-type H+-transporting ATPase subunit epsilon